ncbi:MAG: hypothetical protein K1X74_00070 [Pirellulales bacterium]|nr:hypothetical protein [Pirellulales bacterium]
MKRVFMLNPQAGGGAAQRRLAELEAWFRQRTGTFDAELCLGRDDTIRRTREALRAGADQIIAVGGDGTVNAVANGFFADGQAIRPEAVLAVARVGTGSDFFRTISGTRPIDWREIVLEGLPRAVDIGLSRRLDPAAPCPRYFVNIASFGMSAEIVADKERLPRWLPRSLCYLVPTITNCFKGHTWNVRLELDGKLLERRTVTLMAGKGVYAGGGMRFGGLVAPDDGWFEVTVFGPMPVARMLLKTPKLYRGDFEGEPAIEKLRARRVVLRAEPQLPSECDGELFGTADWELELLPRALRVSWPS